MRYVLDAIVATCIENQLALNVWIVTSGSKCIIVEIAIHNTNQNTTCLFSEMAHKDVRTV